MATNSFSVFRAPRLVFVSVAVVLVGLVSGCFGGVLLPNEQHSDSTQHAADSVLAQFEQRLNGGVLFPGLTGYCGWNYECAVGLWAVHANDRFGLSALPDTLLPSFSNFLERAAKFPFPGSNIRQAAWLYAPGDRIGLFGALYAYISSQSKEAEEIAEVVREKLKSWPRREGCFARNIGWGPVFGISVHKDWIWADDLFIGGFPLLYTDPQEWARMILSYKRALQDPTDGLWWHGVKLLNGGKLEPNGVKWGRANAWILLSVASYSLEAIHNPTVAALPETEAIRPMLFEHLDAIVPFQRQSGAFGNVIDIATSPDETSLTSAFVFASGVQRMLDSEETSEEHTRRARAAWEWLGERSVNDINISETCGGQHLERNQSEYDKHMGSHAGPAVSLLIWARLGATMLEF